MPVGGVIGVLITRRCDAKKGFEFRVAYMPNAIGLITNPDYPSPNNPAINRDFALKVFGNCRVVFNKDSAYNKVKLLANKIGLPANEFMEFDQTSINFPAYRRREKLIGHMPFRCQTR